MEKKSPQSYRLTAEAKRLLALLAEAKGITTRAILEILIRDEARRNDIK